MRMKMTQQEVNSRLSKILSDLDKQSVRMTSGYEREVVRQYKIALKEIKSKIASLFEKLGNDVTYPETLKFNRLVNLETSIKAEVMKLNRVLNKNTKTAIIDIYSQNYYVAGFAQETSLGVALGFGTLNPSVIERAIYNPLDRIGWNTRQAKHSAEYVNAIREEITQGLIQGKGYPEITRNINKRTALTADKTQRIVQTEAHRVQNQGINDAYQRTLQSADRLGMNIKKIWVATLDSKTRDQHADMDGRAADEEGVFELPDGSTGEAPGMIGLPEHDINCRCTTKTEIEGYGSQKRKDNESKKIINYKTYHEWANGKGIKY